MRAKYLWMLTAVLLILLPSCQTKTPERAIPTVLPLRVQLTPITQTWSARLSDCSRFLTASNLLVDVKTPDRLDFNAADLTIKLGEKNGNEPYLSVLGFEQIRFIRNASNPIETIADAELQQILTGEVSDWNQLSQGTAGGTEFSQPITFFIYEPDHELTVWLQKLIPEQLLREDVHLALSADLMLESVRMTPGALGMILESAALPETSFLEVLDAQAQPIRWQLPVLAITASEAEGDLLQLLLCLQQAD